MHLHNKKSSGISHHLGTEMATVHRNYAGILVLTVVMVTIVFYSKTLNWSQPRATFDLSFISRDFQTCDEIVPDISMSELYHLMNPEFELAIKKLPINERVERFSGQTMDLHKIMQYLAGQNRVKAVPINETVEGFSGQVMGQYKTMHFLAGQNHVKTVCETGFNLGHSSFNYLTANDKLIVHSFDLGNHRYAHNMSEYMRKKFPNRFFIHFGDSTKTLPEFILQNPGFKCDYIFVDGGHVYKVALADITNFAKIANLEENIILLDDYPTNWGVNFGKAWDDMVKKGVIKEEMRCTFRAKRFQRGFTIGRVSKQS